MAKIRSSAADYLPARKTLNTMRKAAQGCRGCDLYERATQAVFGEGPSSSRMVLIGEEPGDQEDLRGHPFVGPAGKLLDRALVDAGMDREALYLTNAVKHFKFEERGKRRIHKKPTMSEVMACKPWLEAEMLLVRPKVIVCLGATAAQCLFGSAYRLTKDRGKFVKHPWAPFATSTIHPSAILRAPDREQREAEYQHFVRDLRKASRLLRGDARKP